jgi:2-polyprenyl-3-methyl-5-hydroxy-6-metoxy-1,4-benzoquinol methylase
MSKFKKEVEKGQRFRFGKNWQSFLATLTEERIQEAEKSLIEMLNMSNLIGKKFLDVGCGSGLFSLAAHRLGAEVYSFDFDPSSVACALTLKTKYYSGDQNWTIREGSVLDESFLRSLGSFDVVYSWGVLHHTSNMWGALNNMEYLVKNNGILFIAIYNNQGKKSKIWKSIKKLYCSGIFGRIIVSGVYLPYFFSRTLLSSILSKENVFVTYKKHRGMSVIHDIIDWIGGFPFEVASVEEIFKFYRDKNFVLNNIKTTNSLGCNQFVFVKKSKVD